MGSAGIRLGKVSRSLVLADRLEHVSRVEASKVYGEPCTGTFCGQFLFIVDGNEAILECLELFQIRFGYLRSLSVRIADDVKGD